MEVLFMKRKVIFMGLVVILSTGNEVFSRPQPVPTGIFNASWGTLAKQGSIVLVGAAVLGGLAYYYLRSSKSKRVFSSTVSKGNPYSVEYIRDKGMFFRDKCYKIETINGVVTKKEITKQEFDRQMELAVASYSDFSRKIDQEMVSFTNRMNSVFGS